MTSHYTALSMDALNVIFKLDARAFIGQNTQKNYIFSDLKRNTRGEMYCKKPRKDGTEKKFFIRKDMTPS